MILPKILVSVVIPTYNRCRDLERALRSVLQQTLDSFEIVVVDNHSEDGTDALISGLNSDRIRLIKIHNNGVIAASRNKGIQEAKGKYIAFLDSDDWWTPEKLQLSVDALERENDFVYHELWVVRSEAPYASRRPIHVKTLSPPVFNDLLEKGGVIATSSVVVRTELIKKVNGFSEEKELVIVEDYDCWLRIAKLSNRFYCLPGFYGYYWDGVMSQSRNSARVFTANRRLYELYLSWPMRKSKSLPVWYLYTMGRAHYLMGNWESARMLLKQLLFRKTTWMIKLKTLWMLTVKQKQPIG